MGRHYEGCGKQCSVFNIHSVGPVVKGNSGVTTLLPGIGSSHAMASVSAQGHSCAQSDFTATELSVSRWELMLSVRCQVELSKPLKEESIVCESPGHCHTTFLAASRDETRRLLKWSDFLLVEVTTRRNVVYFYSKATCIWEMLHESNSHICHWWICTVYRDPSDKGSHKNKWNAISFPH